MKRRVNGKLRSLAVATVLLLYPTASSLAASVTEPGETVGLPNGTPAPPGLYLANEANYGCRSTSPQKTCVLVDVAFLAWSTPWTIFGGRLVFVAAGDAANVSILNTTSAAGLANPFVAGILAWDLGHDWGFSYMLGGYFDVDTPTAFSSSSLNQRFALSYSGNDWNLTANVIWGINFDQLTSKPEGFPCPPVSTAFPTNGCNPNFINLDLTATKKFGKWELGPVAFYSSDLSKPEPGYPKQSQFGLGGLIGYWFGPVVLQAYVTTNLYENNYGGRDTRLWTRVIVPIIDQPRPAAPSLSK